MAEQVARAWAEEAGIAAVFDSAGISDEEWGAPINPPAARVLRKHGYPIGDHRAHRITREEADAADYIICMEQYHLNNVARRFPQATGLYLLTDFDPEAPQGAAVPDPWAMPDSAFERTLAQIEAAMPGLLSELAEG
jgi:protein-tyrosine phosphatase